MNLISFVKDSIGIQKIEYQINLEWHMNESQKRYNSKKLDSNNLITLYSYYHKQAGQGIITIKQLQEIILKE